MALIGSVSSPQALGLLMQQARLSRGLSQQQVAARQEGDEHPLNHHILAHHSLRHAFADQRGKWGGGHGFRGWCGDILQSKADVFCYKFNIPPLDRSKGLRRRAVSGFWRRIRDFSAGSAFGLPRKRGFKD